MSTQVAFAVSGSSNADSAEPSNASIDNMLKGTGVVVRSLPGFPHPDSSSSASTSALGRSQHDELENAAAAIDPSALCDVAIATEIMYIAGEASPADPSFLLPGSRAAATAAPGNAAAHSSSGT